MSSIYIDCAVDFMWSGDKYFGDDVQKGSTRILYLYWEK